MLELSTIQKRKTQPNDTIVTGEDGANSVKTSSAEPTLPLREYPATNPSSSPGPSLKYTGDLNLISQGELLGHVSRKWGEVISSRPFGHWRRRSATISGKVPFTSMEAEEEQCIPKSEN